MRVLVRLLAISLVFSVLGPSLVCGGGPTTTREASDCCRAMHFACHKAKGGGTCCKHQASAAAPLAVAALSRSPIAPQPSFTAAFLAAGSALQPLLPSASFSNLSAARHPPPTGPPLFLVNSALLI
jgi:hypothetical protein